MRRKLLTFFYVNRKARVYVRQLAQALQADSTNLSRELARLEKEGLLRSESEGRQLYYSLNHASSFLKPLFALLRGSIGIVPALKHALGKVSGIRSAWVYGSFAKNEADAASDVDVLVVGQPAPAALAAEMRKAEKALHREINYTVLSPRELARRLKARDSFLTDVWKGKRILLIGHDQDEAAKSRSKAG
ncbi:MAG: nucleotidyltransferase domain-containing protein [Terracidiphilus sp.]